MAVYAALGVFLAGALTVMVYRMFSGSCALCQAPPRLPGGATGPATALGPRLPAVLPLRYHLAATYDTGLTALKGIDLDTADRLYAAGAEGIAVLDRNGTRLRRWKTSGAATCVAVGQSGHVYVGLSAAVEKFDRAGTAGSSSSAGAPLAKWGTEGKGPGQFGLVTSIAVAEPNVYVADAGNRCIHRFAADGDFIQEIGKRDREARVPGLIVPSPYLDCAVDTRGVLHVGNSGRLQVERYTADGRFLGAWGQAGRNLEDFPGCCNPTNLTVMPDGRVVTGEKGFPRVKVHDRAGRLLAVMGEDIFPPATAGLDLAVDSRGRIYVADPSTNAVRVFAQKEPAE